MLERAFDKLKPDGVVFVRVPNFGALNARLLGPRWCGIRLPDHLNYFTNAQLRAMAEGAGYRYRLLNRFTLATDDNIKALLVRPAESKIDEGRVDLHLPLDPQGTAAVTRCSPSVRALLIAPQRALLSLVLARLDVKRLDIAFTQRPLRLQAVQSLDENPAGRVGA